MLEQQKWPNHIYIVRHGESAGNVARDLAHLQNKPFIEIEAGRDMDVPLSALGHRQAAAVGRWFGSLPPEEQPTSALCSSYLRAKDTALGLAKAAGWDLEDLQITTDERLREREFGILDRLTTLGIEQQYPDQAKMRRSLGKFYYRPPGGESWCDVILRLRSVIDTITREYRGQNVLIVCHTVVVLCFRYLLERLDEEQVLQIDRQNEVANCSVTAYCFDQALGKNGKLKLNLFNFVAPLEEAGEPVTREPDVPVAPK
jgi:broad specificity phosphatase PhoE